MERKVEGWLSMDKAVMRSPPPPVRKRGRRGHRGTRPRCVGVGACELGSNSDASRRMRRGDVQRDRRHGHGLRNPCFHSRAQIGTQVSTHDPTAIAGGISCLSSSPAATTAAPRVAAHDELGALWHDRSDELGFAGGGGSYAHSSSSPFKWHDHHHSPVSVFNGHASSWASRSPPASWLAGLDVCTCVCWGWRPKT